MNKIFSAGAASVLLAILAGGPVFADDKPLIWQPSKTSATSYSVKLGLKLPTRIEAEAGVSMGINTTSGGAAVDTPIKFWGNFTAREIQTPAYQMERDVGVKLDGQTGSGAITMNYYEKEIATPAIDIERRSSYGIRYDGVAGEWCGVDTSQSLRFSHSGSGTSVIARASARGGFKVVGAGIGVEKKFGKNLTVTGAVDRSSDAAEPVASVNARYSFKW